MPVSRHAHFAARRTLPVLRQHACNGSIAGDIEVVPRWAAACHGARARLQAAASCRSLLLQLLLVQRGVSALPRGVPSAARTNTKIPRPERCVGGV